MAAPAAATPAMAAKAQRVADPDRRFESGSGEAALVSLPSPGFNDPGSKDVVEVALPA